MLGLIGEEMTRTNTRRPVAIILAVLLAPLTDAAANFSSDQIANSWHQRAQVAAKRLSEPGLDACDSGREVAFQHPRAFVAGILRHYELSVQVSGQTLRVSYSYNGQNLASFELISLPLSWIARQRVDSKTLSILVGPANCALDFCTNDPFALGPCSGDKPE